jgi:hypothetical protein
VSRLLNNVPLRTRLKGLLRGQAVAIDATTLEANAAIRRRKLSHRRLAAWIAMKAPTAVGSGDWLGCISGRFIPSFSIAMLTSCAVGLPSAVTHEALSVNADDPPTLAGRCKTITRANVCALEMLACNGARNAVRLPHILDGSTHCVSRHEVICVLQQRLSEILRVNGCQMRACFCPCSSLLLQKTLKKLLWRCHAANEKS